MWNIIGDVDGEMVSVLKEATKVGYKLAKDKKYKRMDVLGVTGSYNRRPASWEVWSDYIDNATF